LDLAGVEFDHVNFKFDLGNLGVVISESYAKISPVLVAWRLTSPTIPISFSPPRSAKYRDDQSTTTGYQHASRLLSYSSQQHRHHTVQPQQSDQSPHPFAMATPQGAISKRRKFVADGVFYAELNEFFQRELAEEGYSGVEVRVTPTVTDISKHTSSSLYIGRP
jgi:hypothetical protein